MIYNAENSNFYFLDRNRNEWRYYFVAEIAASGGEVFGRFADTKSANEKLKEEISELPQQHRQSSYAQQASCSSAELTSPLPQITRQHIPLA